MITQYYFIGKKHIPLPCCFYGVMAKVKVDYRQSSAWWRMRVTKMRALSYS